MQRQKLGARIVLHRKQQLGTTVIDIGVDSFQQGDRYHAVFIHPVQALVHLVDSNQPHTSCYHKQTKGYAHHQNQARLKRKAIQHAMLLAQTNTEFTPSSGLLHLRDKQTNLTAVKP